MNLQLDDITRADSCRVPVDFEKQKKSENKST